MPATNWTWIKEYMPLIRYAGTAVLTLLFLLLVVKPLLKGLAGIRPLGSLGTKGTLLSESALALPEGETRRALEAPKDKEAELIEMAKKDPDHFAGLMKNWLRP